MKIVKNAMLVLNRDQFIDLVVSRNLYDNVNLVWNFDGNLYFEGYMDTEASPEKVIINEQHDEVLNLEQTPSDAIDSYLGLNPKTYIFENNCRNYLINRNPDIRKQYIFSEFINCEFISSEGVHKVNFDKMKYIYIRNNEDILVKNIVETFKHGFMFIIEEN